VDAQTLRGTTDNSAINKGKCEITDLTYVHIDGLSRPEYTTLTICLVFVYFVFFYFDSTINMSKTKV